MHEARFDQVQAAKSVLSVVERGPGDRREDAARWEIGSISDMDVFSALISQHTARPAAWRSPLRFSRGNTDPRKSHSTKTCITIRFVLRSLRNMKSESANKKTARKPDASASYASGIGIIVPFTQAALAWLKEHCSTESWQWTDDILYVDRRMMEDIVQGMASANLVVSSEP